MDNMDKSDFYNKNLEPPDCHLYRCPECGNVWEALGEWEADDDAIWRFTPLSGEDVCPECGHEEGELWNP